MVSGTGNHFSSLPEVVHAPLTQAYDRRSAHGKQVDGGAEKETFEPYVHKEAAWTNGHSEQQSDGLYQIASPGADHEVKAGRRNPRRILWIGAVVLLLVALGVGLGVGLTVGTKSSDSSSDASSGGGSPSTSTPTSGATTQGAMARSGLSTCLLPPNPGLSWPSQLQPNQSNLLLFFQHSSGEIRVIYNPLPGGWSGGSSKEVVANDAKDGTPISIRCPGGADQSGGLNVFYIDKGNILRQRSIDNLTYVWTDGALNNLNVKTFDSEYVGLAAGFYAGTIGDLDLKGTSAFSGTRVLVGTSATTFEQYSWRPGLPQWVYEKTWPGMNAEAVPAMYGWAAGHTFYATFIDEQNDAVVWWFDSASDKVSTNTHLLNVWTESTIKIPDLDPSAGLDFHGNLYGRVAGSGKIQGWNMTWEAENSTIGSTTLSEVAGPVGIPGTRVVAAAYPAHGQQENIFVFYQANGNEIVMSTGDIATGSWNSTTLPIPDA